MHRQPLNLQHPRLGLSLGALALSFALAGCAGHNSNTSSAIGPAPTGNIGPNTLNVADAAIAGGDPTMALSVSQSILATDPNNVDALVHEGEAYYALNRCPASEAAYKLALKVDAKSAAAETGLGRCLLRVNPAQAETAFAAATQDDPGNGEAFNDLGIARDLQGNYPGAAAAYQQALLDNPGSTPTAVNFGLSLALSGQGAEALQYLGPLATGPEATPKIREDYAAALVASGRNDDARQILAIDMPPDQINQTMTGFQTLIAQNMQNPAPPAPPPPTATQVQTSTVTSMPMSPQSVANPAPLIPASAPPPVMASAAVPVPPPVPAPAVTPAPIPAPARMAQAAASPAIAEAPHKQIRQLARKPAAVARMAPIEPTPAPAAFVVHSPAAPSGISHAVQLASLNSQDAANAEWRKVSAAAPGLFAGKSPDIRKVEVDGKTYYRLRVAGFATHQDASQFCTHIQAGGGSCMPANF